MNRLLSEANLKKLKLHSSSPNLSKFIVIVAVSILPFAFFLFSFTFTLGTNLVTPCIALASEMGLQRLGSDKQSKKPTKKTQRTTTSSEVGPMASLLPSHQTMALPPPPSPPPMPVAQSCPSTSRASPGDYAFNVDVPYDANIATMSQGIFLPMLFRGYNLLLRNSTRRGLHRRQQGSPFTSRSKSP